MDKSKPIKLYISDVVAMRMQKIAMPLKANSQNIAMPLKEKSDATKGVKSKYSDAAQL